RLDGALGGEGPLVARGLADEQAAVLGQADEGGQDRVAALVGEDVGLAVADDGHFAVGGPQVDADNRFRHVDALKGSCSPLPSGERGATVRVSRRAPARSGTRGRRGGSRGAPPQSPRWTPGPGRARPPRLPSSRGRTARRELGSFPAPAAEGRGRVAAGSLYSRSPRNR